MTALQNAISTMRQQISAQMGVSITLINPARSGWSAATGKPAETPASQTITAHRLRVSAPFARAGGGQHAVRRDVRQYTVTAADLAGGVLPEVGWRIEESGVALNITAVEPESDRLKLRLTA